MRWWVLGLLVGTSLPGQTGKVGPVYKITGLVVDARDRAPGRHCHMAARLVEGGRVGRQEPVLADTDEDGRFALDVGSAGNWEVTASGHNIRTQPLDVHEGYFTGVILTAAAPVYDLVFAAVPDAVLRGTVTDEAGEAVRGAQVLLFEVNPAARHTGAQPLQQRNGTQTDDRGHYELAGLEPGQYMVQVQARPWYAESAYGPMRGAGIVSAPSPDPSLDLVYPATWYPGVADSAAAELLTAHAGESLAADFRLSPVAAAHLVISGREQQPATASPTEIARPRGDRQPGPGVGANVALVLPNGTTQQVFGNSFRMGSGGLDIGGLAPGTYQVTVMGGPGQPGTPTLVQVGSGGASVTWNAGSTTEVTIAVVDGGTNLSASQVTLRSTVTGQIYPMMDHFIGGPPPPGANGDRGRQQTAPRGLAVQGPQRGRLGGPARGRRGKEGEDTTLQVPSGSYEVGLAADSSTVYLTGVSAKGATVNGKTVTVGDAPVSLTVHLASGPATVEGTASFDGKAAAGAMVLLVPATLGDPASLTVVRRDQTNTDGSFKLDRVIPGQYILLAIDHGWGVRWTDPETLRPYLMQGTPLDLRSGSRMRQTIAAVAP